MHNYHKYFFFQGIMIDMVKADCSLVSHHNKLTFIIINLAIYLAEKNNNACIGYNIFSGNYILNARHSHVSQHKAASIGHHEEVWLHCPTHTNTHTYIHTHIHIYTHTHTYTYTHTYTHTHTYTYIHTHTHILTLTVTYICIIA